MKDKGKRKGNFYEMKKTLNKNKHTCRVTPLITHDLFSTFTDAMALRNNFPSEPAEKCITWLASNYYNHDYFISHGAVDLFLSHLSAKWYATLDSNKVNRFD